MRRRRQFLVPEVVQTSATDCGPACLKCLLEGYGITASYGRLREACQTDLDGTSIATIEEVAVEETAEGFRIRFEAIDPGGRIAAAERALGDGSWSFLEPEDGVVDSSAESYVLVVPHDNDGSEGVNLRLRVTDASGNVAGTYRQLLRR